MTYNFPSGEMEFIPLPVIVNKDVTRVYTTYAIAWVWFCDLLIIGLLLAV